jgi:hypothetical protein
LFSISSISSQSSVAPISNLKIHQPIGKKMEKLELKDKKDVVFQMWGCPLEEFHRYKYIHICRVSIIDLHV